MLRLVDCAGRVEVGAKAEVLARGLLQGLPVLDGWVVLPGEPAAAVAAALPEALRALGGACFAVRSSALVEDLAERSAAGLFLTQTNVPAALVGDAVAAVRASGQSAAVQRYAGAAAEVAVLVQRQVAAAVLGVLYLPAPGDSGGVFAEERVPDEPEWGQVQRVVPGEELLAQARALAALVQASGPALVEYAVEVGGTVVLLQARPAPAPAQDVAGWRQDLGLLALRLDREHNPDPLSPAQAGLVALVEPEAQRAGFTQRVVRGYLYWAPWQGAALPGIAPVALQRRFRDEILPQADRLLAPLEALAGGAQGPPLEQALVVYQQIYRRYVGEISPAVRRAREHLSQFLLAQLGEDLPRHAALLGGLESETLRRAESLYALGQDPSAGLLAAHLRRYGAYAPCWDVAVPCDDEVPERVLQMAQVLRSGPGPRVRFAEAEGGYHQVLEGLLQRLSRLARGTLQALLPAVRGALSVAEDDDALFFRAQRVVRRALLSRGQALLQAGRLDAAEQVFWLGIDPTSPDAVRLTPSEADDLRSRAAQAQAEQTAQQRLLPPDRFDDGQPIWALPSVGVLRGYGVPTPGRAPVRGRALVIRSLAHPPRPDDAVGAVLVLPVLLPSWAPWLLGAAALVTDSGGALSHGATLAREGGLPAVVGTGHATRRIADGDQVIVDAAAGEVYCEASAQAGSTPGRVQGR